MVLSFHFRLALFCAVAAAAVAKSILTIEVPTPRCNSTSGFSEKDFSLSLLHAPPLPRQLFPSYPLSGDALRRSLVRCGSDGRLSKFAAKLRVGETVTVVVIGGSVPAGANSVGVANTSPAKFCAWLRARYPSARITLSNLAVPGTTSGWRYAEFGDVRAARPDLVLYDYTSNDDRDTSNPNSLHETAAVSERLVRAILELPQQPALIFVVLFRGFEIAETTYNFPSEKYEPLADSYGFPLVSFKAAVWPVYSNPPAKAAHLFDCAVTIHPLWYVHQLIADCLAYALVVAETNGPPQNIVPIPAEPLFHSHQVDALAVCSRQASPDRALTRTPLLEPIRVGKGWHFDESERHAHALDGWQYDLSSDDVGSTRPFDVGSSIAFNISFARDPTLLLSYVRSYANFGSAVFWFDANDKQAETMLAVQRTYATKCDHAHEQSTMKGKHNSMQYASTCNRHRAAARDGETDAIMPFVLEGAWADRSSQEFSQGFQYAYARQSERYLPGTPAYYTLDMKNPLLTPGDYTISFAFLRPAPQSRHNYNRTCFKLLAIRAC